MQMNTKPARSITEVLLESRRLFEEKFGRLLTEEEAIELTEKLRKGDIDED